MRCGVAGQIRSYSVGHSAGTWDIRAQQHNATCTTRLPWWWRWGCAMKSCWVAGGAQQSTHSSPPPIGVTSRSMLIAESVRCKGNVSDRRGPHTVQLCKQQATEMATTDIPAPRVTRTRSVAHQPAEEAASGQQQLSSCAGTLRRAQSASPRAAPSIPQMKRERLPSQAPRSFPAGDPY